LNWSYAGAGKTGLVGVDHHGIAEDHLDQVFGLTDGDSLPVLESFEVSERDPIRHLHRVFVLRRERRTAHGNKYCDSARDLRHKYAIAGPSFSAERFSERPEVSVWPSNVVSARRRGTGASMSDILGAAGELGPTFLALSSNNGLRRAAANLNKTNPKPMRRVRMTTFRIHAGSLAASVVDDR
jgi:hypothetical protein